MIKEFTLPLKNDELKNLSVGDIVYLSGKMFTARDEAHRLFLKDENISLPFDPSEMALYHCGPLIEKKGKKWNVISAGPTTSSRMDGFSKDFIDRFSIHAIIGKGMMGNQTRHTLKDKGVFFVFTGGAGALAADLITKVNDVYWLDELGMAEAVWLFTVKRFGPLVVAIDSKGNSIF